jgi:hypothetical protein
MKTALLWLPASLFAVGYITLMAAGIYGLFGMWVK